MYLRPQQKKPAKEHDNDSVHAPPHAVWRKDTKEF